ncbi:MAG: BT4734/BF3469 family protein, partial [Mucilaginibacter sp.]
MSKDIIFSAYADAYSKKPIRTSFLKIMAEIKNGTHWYKVERVRISKPKVSHDQYMANKETLYCFTTGVNSSKEGKGSPLPKDMTGLVCLDIDDKSQDQKINKEKLKSIPWVLAVGLSAGGVGLFAVVKGPADQHRTTFANAVKLLGAEGLQVNVADGQQNENRLRYISFDPDLYFVEEPRSAPFVPIVESPSLTPLSENVQALSPRPLLNQIERPAPRSLPATPTVNNDNPRIFEKIFQVKTRDITIVKDGNRHAYLRGIVAWCNHIGMSRDFVLTMTEKHCRGILENGADYPLERKVGEWYREWKGQHGTCEWKDGMQEPQQKPSSVFIPDWTNKPPYVPPVVKLAGTNILTYQNITGIIAAPGSGKTSCMEAIAASFLNPQSDCLGFVVDPSCKGVVIIDTERPAHDVWNSFDRMCRRAAIPYGTAIERVKIIGMRGVSDPDERKRIIEDTVRDKNFSLLLIDGVGHLVRDTNNTEQVDITQAWMRKLTADWDISIIGTLHPNPGSDKARGHSGSEMLRDTETILAIKEEKGVKIITSNFQFGKNRHSGKITAGIVWSDEKMMFVTSDAIAGSNELDREQAAKIVEKVLPKLVSRRYLELASEIEEITGLGIAAAKR